MSKILHLILAIIILITAFGCNSSNDVINNINTELLTENSIDRFNDFKKSFETIDSTSEIGAIVYGVYIDLPIKDICSLEKEILELSEKNIQKYQTGEIPEKFVGIKYDNQTEIMAEYRYFLEKCKDLTVVTDIDEFTDYAKTSKSVSSEYEQQYVNEVYSIMRSYVITAYTYSTLYDILASQMDVSFLTTPYLALYETANSIYYVNNINDLSQLAEEISEISDKARGVYDLIANEITNLADISETTTETTTITQANFNDSPLNSIKYGELLDSTVTELDGEKILVVKAKIEPNLTNRLTIDQNYYNVADIVQNHSGILYDEIQYWAVADMTDGSESKVISFTIDHDVISGINNKTIAENQIGNYATDLFILPSLLE